MTTTLKTPDASMDLSGLNAEELIEELADRILASSRAEFAAGLEPVDDVDERVRERSWASSTALWDMVHGELLGRLRELEDRKASAS